MDVPLARFLTRFAMDDEDVDPEPAAEPAAEPILVVDPIETRLATALAEIEARHAEQLTSLRTRLESEAAEALTRARAEWCESQSAKLADRIDQAMPHLRTYLSDRIADVLTPLVASAVVDRTRAAVMECLDTLLADENHPVITLHAPADLVDAMRTAQPSTKGIQYVVREEVDALITADGLHIRTCLQDALKTLAEAGD